MTAIQAFDWAAHAAQIEQRRKKKELLRLMQLKQQRVFDRDMHKAETHLHTFLRLVAWPAVLPGVKFVDNWHLHAICEHLEAVKRGQIRRLIINLPFRLLKSTIISQAFPAWEWVENSWVQYLTASYAKEVATRDAVNCRRIIESELYQRYWGNRFCMTTDQNVKTRYENNKGGARTVTSTDAAGTGFGGNRVLVDDPVSAKDANSQTAIETSIDWWKGTASTRLNNPEEDALVVTHQRLHQRDLTGHILAEETGWVHLVLPMRYEPKKSRTTVIGFKDPRTIEGELLHPARLSEATVKEMEMRLGTYHTAAQLQQDPPNRGGQVFDSSWFGRYAVLPVLKRRKVFIDTAQKTKEENDYSVLLHAGLGDDGKLYILDVLRGKWEAWELEQKAVDFWKKHQAFDFKRSCVLSQMKVEDKSSGTGLIQYIRKKGHIPVVEVPRHKDKLVRAYDGQPFMQAGLVCIPEEADWVMDYCTEFDRFTKNDTHEHDDQIDPTLDAIEDFLGTGGSSMFDSL